VVADLDRTFGEDLFGHDAQSLGISAGIEAGLA
jgi:hypothetical protein